MKNENCSFEEWHDLLMQVASDYGGSSILYNKKQRRRTIRNY